MTEKIRGYLTVSVAEASGKNKEDDIVWDGNFVEGFVKVEVRGGPRNIKVSSSPKRVLANSIQWGENLTAEVLEESRELRIMLCREKRTGTRVGTSVIAACGIFINDILEAVPIDKYFELFKPGAGGEGGFIRIGMNFSKERGDNATTAPSGPLSPVSEGQSNSSASFKPVLSMSYDNEGDASEGVQYQSTEDDAAADSGTGNGRSEAKRSGGKQGGKKTGPLKVLLLAGLVGGVATVAIKKRQQGK